MPTYQYACKACGENTEAVQSFTDAPLTECPACGGALRKVFSAVGVVFKGSGFYKTDSRAGEKKSDSAPAKAGGATSDAKSSEGASTESKSTGSTSGEATSSDSKPPAKTETSKPATKTPAA